MNYSTNVYCNPEKHGLEVVGELEDPNASYSFATVVFWRKGRKVYAASDSGCSCPSPFEDYNSIEELTPVTSMRAAQDLIESAEADFYTHYNIAEKRNLIRRVGDVLQGKNAPATS